MAAPPFIAARVTPEMKSLLRVLAEREQKTESAVVRQLLEVVLRTSAVGEIRLLDEKPRPNRDIRLYVRLDPNDRLLLKERAAPGACRRPHMSPRWCDPTCGASRRC